MKKTAAHSTTNSSHDAQLSFGILSVGREFADTTWRIAAPVLLFAGIGILLDKQFGSKPWLTLFGMLVGFVFAGLLVKRQIGGDNADGESQTEEQQ